LYRREPCEGGALFCADTDTLGVDSDTLTRVGQEKEWDVIVGGTWTGGGISSGRLWLWGDDFQESTPSDRFIEIPGQRPWQDLALGDRHACAIQGGELHCWGDNQHGQLGDGTTEPRRQPQRVGNGDGWTDVTAAEDITCGIQDGALYCWGVTAFRYSPQSKQVSPPLFTSTPRLADPQRDWIAVETSPTQVCGLRSGGRLACREHAFFRVGVDGKPLKPAELEPTPFAPPGTRRYGF